MGVALRPSPITSCAFTRGGRVESPIMLFLTQQLASRGRVMGEGRGVFRLNLVVCLLSASSLLGDCNGGLFEGRVILGLLGVGSVIGLVHWGGF